MTGPPRSCDRTVPRQEPTGAIARLSEHDCARTAVDCTGLETLETIAADDWDRLVQPGDLFCDYSWLRHLDDVATPHRIVTVRTAGRLIAAAPVWDGEHTPGLFYLPDLCTGLDGPWHEPFVWLGARRSVRNGVIGVGGPLRAPALRHLMSTAREHARAQGRAGVVAPYLPLAAARELAATHQDARLVLHGADAVIDVPSDGTTGLIARASGHNRKRRLRELRDFAAGGHTLEWTDVTAEVARAIAPLITNTRRKYGSAQGVSYMDAIFTAQRAAGLLDRAKAVLCHRDGALVAAAVCYRHGDSLHGRYFGAAETAARLGSPYFITTCVAPVDYAARHGMQRVLLATSSLQAKSLRGARLQPLAAVVLLGRGALDTASVSAHNRRFVLDHRERYSAALDADWLDPLDNSKRGNPE